MPPRRGWAHQRAPERSGSLGGCGKGAARRAPSLRSPLVCYGPIALPTAPLGVTAVAANSSAVVSWQPPAFDGGLPVSNYTVVAAPGGSTAVVAGSLLSATVNGLANGTTYTFAVLPANSVGNGYWSDASNGIVPTSVPRSPLNVSAASANFGASASWSAPSYDGGSPVTGYTVTASPGGASVTVPAAARSATVPGLSNSQTYTLSVVASNVNGPSAPSATSNPVVPYPVHAAYTLDAWGGVHADATSAALTGSAYWPNQNRARSAALLPDGSGGYVLDQVGSLHPFGAAQAHSGVAYWPNTDLARDVVLLPGATATPAGGFRRTTGLNIVRGQMPPLGRRPRQEDPTARRACSWSSAALAAVTPGNCPRRSYASASGALRCARRCVCSK